MRLVLASLLAFAPALGAQVQQADSVFFTSPPSSAASRLTAVGLHGSIVGRNESLLAGSFSPSWALASQSGRRLDVAMVLASLRAPDRRGHIWIGAVLGLGLGASAGYLVAIPR